METPWWTNWDLSYTPDVYGPVYGGHSVQEAVYNTLQTWLPAYIMEMNRQLGGEILHIVNDWRYRPEFRTLPKDVECAILVIVPGLAGIPKTLSDSTRANWKVEVNAFVYGSKDWQETEALTSAYAAAVRACLVQKRGLGGFAETTKWVGETYFEGEHSGTRTSGLATINFEVTVGNNVTPYGGPPEPQFAPTGAVTDPSLVAPSDPVYVTDADVTVTKDPL